MKIDPPILKQQKQVKKIIQQNIDFWRTRSLLNFEKKKLIHKKLNIQQNFKLYLNF